MLADELRDTLGLLPEEQVAGAVEQLQPRARDQRGDQVAI
jgi:hypothetical protein